MLKVPIKAAGIDACSGIHGLLDFVEQYCMYPRPASCTAGPIRASLADRWLIGGTDLGSRFVRQIHYLRASASWRRGKPPRPPPPPWHCWPRTRGHCTINTNSNNSKRHHRQQRQQKLTTGTAAYREELGLGLFSWCAGSMGSTGLARRRRRYSSMVVPVRVLSCRAYHGFFFAVRRCLSKETLLV